MCARWQLHSLSPTHGVVLAMRGHSLCQLIFSSPTLLRREVGELASIPLARHHALADQRHSILTLVLERRRHLHVRVLVVLEGGASRTDEVAI